jgi:hypothetical protein
MPFSVHFLRRFHVQRAVTSTTWTYSGPKVPCGKSPVIETFKGHERYGVPSS